MYFDTPKASFMRSHITYTLTILVLLVCVLPANAKPPNILLILADDLGYEDLGYQGSTEILSPNIDHLASGGVRFTDAHTTASVCSPSRAGLITGRYQQRFGHEANTPSPPDGMDTRETTIADRLQKLGYRTAAIGKWHLGTTAAQYPTARGFDTFYGLREGSRSYFYNAEKSDRPGNFHAIEKDGKQVAFDGYLTDVLADQAIDFITQDSGEPFFAYLSFTAPHGPLEATQTDLARFAHIENKRRRTYAAMIWAMDRAIGRVVDQLKNANQLENTLIWFLSDNGGATNNASSNLPLAGHKGIKFEGGIRVPCLLHWPAKFTAGQVEDRMISALDVLPTSLAAAGGQVGPKEPRPLDGVNLLPFLTHENTDVPHQELYWHKLWFSAMRDGPWKLIYVQDYGYALYNLESDLGELHNIAPQEPDRVAAMTTKLNAWKSQMVEPLWGEAEQWFRVHSKNHIRLIERENSNN